MSKFGAFISGIAGIVVLLGYFISSLDSYYLVPIGGALAIIAAIICAKSRGY